jgi:hypothetical protein
MSWVQPQTFLIWPTGTMRCAPIEASRSPSWTNWRRTKSHPLQKTPPFDSSRSSHAYGLLPVSRQPVGKEEDFRWTMLNYSRNSFSSLTYPEKCWVGKTSQRGTMRSLSTRTVESESYLRVGPGSSQAVVARPRPHSGNPSRIPRSRIRHSQAVRVTPTSHRDGPGLGA